MVSQFSLNSMGGVNSCLIFTFPIKQNQDINISMLTVQTGQNSDIDVSLAHPWSQDSIKRASKENGHAATTREEKKMKKYSGELVPGGYVSRCVPLVIEHFGRWGTKAENFLQHLSQQSANPEANFMLPFSCPIGERFSTILPRCSANVILRKLSKLSPNHGDLDRLFDFDIESQVH